VRAVLDPNVLISALLSRDGTPAKLIALWLRGEFELIVSPQLLDELERALAYPKIRARLDEDAASEFLDLLRAAAVPAEDVEPTPRSADPADDYLIALAEHSRAILVSGDKDLLELGPALPIENPARFLRRLPGA
jgi:uncharacterized protein